MIVAIGNWKWKLAMPGWHCTHRDLQSGEQNLARYLTGDGSVGDNAEGGGAQKRCQFLKIPRRVPLGTKIDLQSLVLIFFPYVFF